MFSDRSPLAMLGYLLGALSLLDLIEDLKFEILTGKVKEWVDAWGAFVHAIGQALFGWLSNDTFGISEWESNIVVMTSLFLSAVFRAFIRLDPKSDGDDLPVKIMIGIVAFGFALVPVSAAAFLLPSWMTTTVAVLCVLLFAYGFYDEGDEMELISELLGVLAVAAVLVALSRLVI